MNHLSPFIKKEFTAELFSCGRTKTAAIVNCMGDYFFEDLKSDIQEDALRIMVPASSDTGIQKVFPVTVQIYDTRFDRMMPKFFDMNLLKGRDVFTAKSMFQTVNSLFTAHSIR